MEQQYTKQNPFLASIKERFCLNKSGSNKNTQHLVLDLSGSNLTYEVGDSIGVFPRHDPKLVEKTLLSMKCKGEEKVFEKGVSKENAFSEFLLTKANITDISPKLFREVYHRQSNPEKKAELEFFLREENRESMKKHIAQHEVWDFLQTHDEVHFAAQELADLLMPMLPRFYSIASSQNHVGNEVHLLIAPVSYESRGYQRVGVSTHYLCTMTPLNEPSIPVFIQPSHNFRLPKDPHVPLIMIGPGTGVAPFRAFLQERLYYHDSKGKHWLFFGEWNRASDFFYEEEWNHFSRKGHLRIDAAFSRDQSHKIYVQHKMQEQAQELYQWIEEGAYLYVCGDANYMAKDVENTLHAILQEQGSMDPKETRDYVKRLRQQKRYLRDVY